MTAGGGAQDIGTTGRFRICVDADLCQGHGVCAEEAPDIFSVDPDEKKVVVRVSEPDPNDRDRVRQAAEHCPTRALTIENIEEGI
ncbi:MAG: ferredoxin [Myxococcota bacterium]|nr:ferredoxin [Myxococcota bacterium]